jgi:dTDP-4-dehydrorhamnose 3,5-epimerase
VSSGGSSASPFLGCRRSSAAAVPRLPPFLGFAVPRLRRSSASPFLGCAGCACGVRVESAGLKITETSLPGVLLLEPRVFGDDRGWFMETFNDALFRQHGLPDAFAQDNHSSSKRGVVRGLHYQLEQPQGKLVRCTRGTILDVAVDIRRGSPTFGKWTSVELSDENRRMLWIPPRFAHGFSVLSEQADLVYKCTTLWHQASDRSLLWNDPSIGIDWRVETALLSPKDAAAKPLSEADLFEF